MSLKKIAEIAGVGVATVDRVLNERGNVSKATVQRVLDVARSLQVRRILPETYHALVRIEVILARPDLPLIARMHQEFNKLMESIDRSVVIHRTILPEESPLAVSTAMRKTTSDAVIIYAPEHELVHSAIEALQARDVVVVTIISDLPRSPRLAYAGTDHYHAGRTAGYLLDKMIKTPGPITVLCNHLGFQSHAERIHGLRDYFSRHSPQLVINDILEGGDELDRSEILLKEAFRRTPDTVGVYNVGAANRAVASAIRANILNTRPIFIGHELTPHTRQMLKDGIMTMTIDQSPERQAQYAVDVLRHHFGFAGLEHLRSPYKSNVPFNLYGPENIVEF